MAKRRFLSWIWGLLWLGGVVGLTFAIYWHFGSPAQTCLSCHEIQAAHDLWARSAHRGVKCESCHGTAVSNGFHSLQENGRRVFAHVFGETDRAPRLKEDQIVQMMDRCKTCHEREHAAWRASGHSMSYADVFLNEQHNRTEQINSDCLRCHGMFFEGTVEDLVAPLSTQGSWKLIKEDVNDRPAIPCQACHLMHLQGVVLDRPDHAQPRRISYSRQPRLSMVGFYDRREKIHFEASLLPIPRLQEGDKPLPVADDADQRLCFQCHASTAFAPLGVGDDRTPRGVHAGLSCSACHASHSMDARHSCDHCHPSLSNCGLDVEKMDTTFRSPESRHNVHFVGCTDCHPAGAPKKK